MSDRQVTDGPQQRRRITTDTNPRRVVTQRMGYLSPPSTQGERDGMRRRPREEQRLRHILTQPLPRNSIVCGSSGHTPKDSSWRGAVPMQCCTSFKYHGLMHPALLARGSDAGVGASLLYSTMRIFHRRAPVALSPYFIAGAAAAERIKRGRLSASCIFCRKSRIASYVA
jgi:hypothetical protein